MQKEVPIKRVTSRRGIVRTSNTFGGPNFGKGKEILEDVNQLKDLVDVMKVEEAQTSNDGEGSFVAM